MNNGIQLGRRSFLAGVGSILTALLIADTESSSGAADQIGDPKHRIGVFDDIEENTIFDVCVIGSGFAGAILGHSLVKHGIKTVIVEAGPEFSAPASTYAPSSKSTDPRFQGMDVYRTSGPINYPVSAARFRGVGGTSWVWGGNCTRLHPLDLEKNSYTPPAAPWPITYAELDPYYEDAEKALRVRGGKPSKHHPPVKVAYPFPSDRDISPLTSLLTKAGVSIADTPYSTRVGHKTSILRDRFGPFLRMSESHLPDFQSSPHASLIPAVTVTRLLIDEQGNVFGAEVKNLDRAAKILRARVYVVACGGLESPRLLLLSRSSRFPKGIGNNYDWVGRCFMEHRPVFHTAQVKIDWSSFSLFQLRGYSYQFYEKFKRQGLGGMRLGFHLEGLASWEELRAGQIGGIARRVLTRQLSIGMETEPKPVPENRVSLDGELKDHFGNPATNLFFSESKEQAQTIEQAKVISQKIFTSLGAEGVEELPRIYGGHHHMGTCRMGDNPRASVVDRNLRVHGTKNLFVAGSSVFVTSGTAHPTLTLTALSLRLADFLRAHLRDNAIPSLSERWRQASRGAAYESFS